jgi:hypothetical protein
MAKRKVGFRFLTKKSQESTLPPCVQVACDTLLESSQWELQLCFRPHHDWRFEREVIALQSCGSAKTKSHLDVGLVERCRVYYMGEDGDLFWIQATMSSTISSMALWVFLRASPLFFLLANFRKNLTWKMWFRPILMIFHGKNGPNSPYFEKIIQIARFRQ